jgi:transposase
MDFRFFIGIDVSKATLDIACYHEHGAFFNYQVPNDSKGFKKMFQWLKTKTDVPVNQWLVCIEHTGVYGWPVNCFLTERKIPFSAQPALHIKRSMGIQRGKNDRSDARMLARFAYLYRKEIQLTVLPSKALLSLKNLLSYRERLVKSKVSLQIAAKELSSYIDKESIDLVAKDSHRHVQIMEQSIRQLDKEIERVIREDKDLIKLYELSTSVKGVGLQIAANLLVYTNGFTRFDNWRKFSCYCGLAPFDYQSGTSLRGKTKVSALGNKKMKAMIGNGVASAIQWDKELAHYYQRKLEEGKHKMVVQTAIKNKIISRVFATVKRGTPYVPLFQFN